MILSVTASPKGDPRSAARVAPGAALQESKDDELLQQRAELKILRAINQVPVGVLSDGQAAGWWMCHDGGAPAERWAEPWGDVPCRGGLFFFW